MRQAIDRYLALVRATEQLWGKSTTKAGPLAFAAPSRSARPAGEAEAEPSFFEACHHRPLRADPQRRVHPDWRAWCFSDWGVFLLVSR